MAVSSAELQRAIDILVRADVFDHSAPACRA